MEMPPITQNYFSAMPSLERTLRRLWAFLLALIVLALVFFWNELRDPESTYSLVSITISSPIVLNFFRSVTLLGSEGFFLVLFSVIYWSVNKILGFWGLIVMPFSIFMTSEIPKDIIRLPRPDVRGVTVPTYTFPSGHTSGAVSVWGFLAMLLKRRWLWLLAALIIVLVGLSRVMLGYHFPGDVLGGIVTGSIFLVFLFWFGSKAEGRNFTAGLSLKYLLAAAVAVPMALSFIPATYAPNLMGYAAGAGAGYLLEREKLNYRPDGLWWQHLARALIGALVIAVITLELAPRLPSSINLFTFAAFGLSTFWSTYLAPLLFIKAGLARAGKINLEK